MAGPAAACYHPGVSESQVRLAGLLRDRSSEIMATWLARFERSPLRFRRTTKAAVHAAQVANLLEALQVASTGGAVLSPGSDASRELERGAAFLGAQFASEGATGFDVAALLLEVRDAVGGMLEGAELAALTALFEWLNVVALDSFAAAGVQSLRERVADQLEVGTPVVELAPRVPALLLVAAPSAAVLDNLLARAWMLAVGTGAPCLIIDLAGLAELAERAFEQSFRGFLDQAAGSAVQLLLVGGRRALGERAAGLAVERGVALQRFDRLDGAIAHALERGGLLLKPSAR
jgi:hypothetical protein